MSNASSTIETRRMKDAIKTLIRKKGYKYEDLAKELGVSLNTVKRVLNKEEITLQRVNDILKWLGVSFSELLDLCEKSGREVLTRFSEQQERFLVENTAHYFIFEELMVGNSVKNVQKKFKLNNTSMQRYLLDLDRQNMLELHENGRIRMLVKALEARRGGPICKMFADRLGPIASDNVELGLLFGNKSPKFSMHFNTNLWVRPKTLEQLHKDITELVDKYLTIALSEQAIESHDNLTPVIWFFIANNTEIHRQIFDLPKNFPGTEQ